MNDTTERDGFRHAEGMAGAVKQTRWQCCVGYVEALHRAWIGPRAGSIYDDYFKPILPQIEKMGSISLMLDYPRKFRD